MWVGGPGLGSLSSAWKQTHTPIVMIFSKVGFSIFWPRPACHSSFFRGVKESCRNHIIWVDWAQSPQTQLAANTHNQEAGPDYLSQKLSAIFPSWPLDYGSVSSQWRVGSLTTMLFTAQILCYLIFSIGLNVRLLCLSTLALQFKHAACVDSSYTKVLHISPTK
jgi:hypothetical protein